MNTIYVVNLDNKNPHISPKWPRVLHRKIDVFLNGKYLHSTNAYANTSKAKLGVAHEKDLFIKGTDKPVKEIKAYYSDRS